MWLHTMLQVVNLVQLDAQRVGDFAAAAHTLWDGLLQMALCVQLARLGFSQNRPLIVNL